MSTFQDDYDERYNQLIYEFNKKRDQPDVVRMIALIKDNGLDIKLSNKSGYNAADHLIQCPHLKNEIKLKIMIASTSSQADEFYFLKLIEKNILKKRIDKSLLDLYNKHLLGRSH